MTIDPISQAVITNLIKLAIETGWKQAGNQIDKKIQQQVGHAIEEYVRTYEKRHCTLKYDCLRMDNSQTLEEIYTDVQVLNTRESRRFESPEALKELFLETGRGFIFEKTTRQEGIAVANLEPRLMVLGSPGIGKSTFLRKVGLEALKWETARYRHELIPVFIELKQFGDQHSEIEKLIAEEFETCGFPNADVFTQNLLKAGKLLILLDGLDEVPTAYVDRAISQIGTFVDKYDKNHFIASCRIAAYKGGFPRFKDVTMANFNDSQMQTFVQQWFRREPKVAEQYWQLLDSSEYKAVKELGQTPLLLTLLCAVYDESQSLPKRRSALYGEALEVWLKKWAAERRVHRDPIYQDLNLQLEQVLLSEIAYQSFAEDQLFFSKRELTDQIRAFLVGNLNAPKHLDAEKVLNAIQVQQGILVERARDTFSFSHLTFQEYLTAQYIVDEQQLETLVTNHLMDRRWREVFFLVTGLVRSADVLLNLMRAKTQELLYTDKLKGLIRWTNAVTTGSAGDFKPAVMRVITLFYALALDSSLTPNCCIALVLALDRYCALNFTLDGALTLDGVIENSITLNHIKVFASINFQVLVNQLEAMKDSVPSDDASLEERRVFISQLRHIWYDALHLNPKLLKLSQEERQSLENYLYANELMIRCKEAALRVSPQVWDAIESRMLTVSDDEIDL
ncbi:signal transduction protein with Nacht domain-containing protein [Leptolyngbya boryana NIES-2135]|jgi:predicted NACHT family NTPase|uniref:Signal transduction protein with Nacht domain-containing protein n=1 Tax=Leptolyngbya boryana NIES-2135 TaxID=1973484 RepID=A0A1Z4JDV0_LEPBY|nr:MULTISPECIES: NACHT domain-containing protein [Leptolyngbya]BAY54833.1 signal transduction protein with Nacht domain-containing protein [Leptolyngbya boryana NIES-2135]MBD2365815.1 NACHT domain-containing protein [Leptolyngbya sp. FACHB-161]MBD2371995.1 NACHT domain-containing protein [Leptolyngbya sp. FACHB-238]MBD2396419.1 NACHT domain-containing protein [Leptolyngbya sp. FACHB-239]MBD2402941.1 NACHT domain-containing protein [Leptolyngbya sp. FACHB-402]